MEKNSVRNLQYGPKTRLIKGMYQGPVVRRPINAQPEVKVNPGFFFLRLKAFSRIIFSAIFKVFNKQLVDKKN